MNRGLLIVDDEQYITDGLTLMLEEADLDVEIYSAYNAQQALDYANSLRIDILLTDIRMPEIDGLELQRLIKNIYPNCITIFLTGHNEFEYVQKAIRNGSSDFILKTEDDDVVIGAVENAIKTLEKNLSNYNKLELAKTYIDRSKPLLRARLWQKIVSGDEKPSKENFRTLEINMNLERNIFIAAGFLKNRTTEDNIPAVLSLFHQYFDHKFNTCEYMYAPNLYLWFLQDISENTGGFNLLGYINSTFDLFQTTCQKQMNVDAKIILQSSDSTWDNIVVSVQRLIKILRQSHMPQGAGVMTDHFALNVSRYRPKDNIDQLRRQMIRLELLPQWIECGDRESALKEITQLFELLNHGFDYGIINEACAATGLILLHYMNDCELLDKPGAESTVEHIISPVSDYNLDNKKRCYHDLINMLCDDYDSSESDQYDRMISHINHYIHSHIDGDLSLAKLGEIVHLNPSYLSRLYRSLTGRSISDTIQQNKLEAAKRLLSQSFCKSNQISEQLGFCNPAHFTRFFKKMTGITPNEYRDKKL